MKSRVHWCVNGAARTTSRAVRNGLLSPAGVACLGLAVAGCDGLTPVTQQDRAQAAIQNVRYTIQDLGVVGANFNAPGQPFVLSNSGWISGGAAVGAAEQAVLWYRGQMIDIGNAGLGGNSIGYGVNESGSAAGEAETTAAGFSTTEDFCGFQAMGFSASPTPCVPFVRAGGRMIPLPTLGGVNGVANEINNRGSIAGYAENATADVDCIAPQKYQFKPAVWNHGAIQGLTTGNDPEGIAFSINDLGQVVGASGSCAPFNPIWLFYLAPAHALLWQNGVRTDLGNLGGSSNNLAHHVNNLGEVVGGSDLAGDQTSHAFLWTPATKMQDLGTVQDTVDNDTFSVGLGINDAGHIVGVSSNADSSIIRGFIRQNGKLVDLNSLISGNTPLYVVTACSINSKGEIIGIAFDPNTGETHGYLATPAPGASSTPRSVVKPPALPESVRDGVRFVRP